MVTAVTSLEISVFIHIAAVVVGFGTSFAEAIALPVAMKLDPRHLPYVYSLQLTINKYFVSPALVLVVVTGFYQAAELDLSMGEFWLSATLAIVIVIAVINFAYFIPTDRKMLALVQRDIAAAGPEGEVTFSEEFNKRSVREGIVGTLVGISLIVAIFLMVVKPG